MDRPFFPAAALVCSVLIDVPDFCSPTFSEDLVSDDLVSEDLVSEDFTLPLRFSSAAEREFGCLLISCPVLTLAPAFSLSCAVVFALPVFSLPWALP